jgi:hypothetical protein
MRHQSTITGLLVLGLALGAAPVDAGAGATPGAATSKKKKPAAAPPAKADPKAKAPAKDKNKKKPPEPEPEIEMGGDTGSSSPGTAAPSPPEPVIDPLAPVAAPPIDWPQPIIDRPRTLPKGVLGLAGDLDINRASVTINAMSQSLTTIGLRLAASYGVSDDLEVGASYEPYLHASGRGFVVAGPLALRGGYRIVTKPKLGAAALLRLEHDFDRKTTDLILGVNLQYRLAAKVAVYTPGDQLLIAVARPDTVDATGMPVARPKPASIHLPIGLAAQFDAHLYAYLELELLKLNLNADANAVLFKDDLPVKLGGFYSLSHKLDLGLALEFPDLKNTAGGWDVVLRARAYRF